MNIGQAAEHSGVSAKMIRHYESIGLLRPAARSSNTYRQYGEQDVHELRFIGRARSLGFSMKEIGELLSLWRDRQRPSGDVRQVAARHLSDLEAKLAEMQAMVTTLRKLIHACHGDERPDCPILEDLAGAPARRSLS
ncbi:MAG: Cu(I)-responsive transcriptional regulator [Rhizobiales bacterium 62-17]|nr:Cu(I)-responsive transcriptional regulator [Hyphomicrobiales bacterium]OJY01905.1 MAG: Cu(I)-responsive transcriptional regulator [Rhizobiales bacterium 62-17]